MKRLPVFERIEDFSIYSELKREIQWLERKVNAVRRLVRNIEHSRFCGIKRDLPCDCDIKKVMKAIKDLEGK